ncbi:hypothetical protein SAMD00023353_7600300 [Rosellinia necatrix]|uniref:PD-(D/E)XK nuclease-like domain-containing protein n=1 Tax=Rosellinia necatrix TaxID=77044 RepID=A0A1W2TUJ8_ROSNE|nr:hypothetical protein SAMD00023353_7600300 [Rosellinia necatrix]
MNNREPIISWIRGLPEYTTCRPTGPTERNLVHQEPQLASPPVSLKPGDKNNLASTPKRRRLEGSDDGSDPDETPRAFADDILSLSDASSVTSRKSGGSGGSGRSGTSSPTKELALLRLAGELEIKSLNVNRFPKVAGSDDLLESMVEIGRGLNILPYRMKSIIEKAVGLGGLAMQWRSTFQSPEIVDDLPGCIPSFEEVEGVVKWAELCQEDECEEAAWNHDVHVTLLRKVFGGAEQEINAMFCTTARPSKYFKPAASTSTGQFIDICIYNSVERDEGLMEKINRFRMSFQTNSINHTDYNPLRTRPLLLSIEAKKPGTGDNKAQLQIGVWHCTQWSFLRWAVSQKLKERAKLEADKTTTEVETDTLACLSKLGFIPGIVVRGHRWCLVLSTYDGKKTTLWEEHRFGTTSSSFDAFCAIAGIRRLTAWATNHYWPWFEENILD